MAEVKPEFYPPRAGRGAKFLDVFFAARRGLSRWERRRRKGLSPPVRAVLVACVPAYGFAARGYTVVALIALLLWGLSAGVLLVFLGREPANYATAVLVGVHMTGLLCGFHRSLFLPKRKSGNGPEILAVFLLVFVGYLLAFQVVRTVAFPAEHRSGVVVLSGLTFVGNLKRGDVVGYRVRHRGLGGGVIVREGYGLDRVVGLPGDRVIFHEDAVEVAGVEYPSQEGMPTRGEMVVPKDRWLIWPSGLSIHAAAEEDVIFEVISRVAFVPKRDIVGKPFEHWFWRKQEYEPVQ